MPPVRSLVAPAVAAVALAALAPAAGAVVYTPRVLPPCATPTSTECIAAVTDDGAPVTIADWAWATLSSPAEGHPVDHPFILAGIGNGPAGERALDPTHVYGLTLRTGALRPAQVFGRGTQVTVERVGTAAAGYEVTMIARPVRLAYTDSGCAGTGVCPAVADRFSAAYWDAQIDDGSAFADPDDQAAADGFHFFSSTDWFSSPPSLDFATHAITVDVANSHFEPDGTTVFSGTAELLLPDAMLTRLYLVDDPATLTTSAFTVGAGGAPGATVTVDRVGSAVRVRFSGLTFSRRRLRVVGQPTPGAPRRPVAVRTGRHRALLGFAAARARGSRVRGYRAVCTSGRQVLRASGSRSPLRLRALIAGRGYRCTIRATSRAGLGAATTVRVRARTA